MDVKPGVEEKRVKTTVIRRRARVEPVPPPPEVPSPSEGEVAPPAVEASPAVSAGEVASPIQVRGGVPATGVEVPTLLPKVEEKEKPRKAARRKSKDELEMEMIARAGGLKKAAELLQAVPEAPERLERVFRPEKSLKRKKVLSKKEFRKTEITTPKAIKRVIRIEGTIAVADLARRMGIKAGEVLKKLIDLGVMATLNHLIDADTALLVAHDFGYEVENVAFTEQAILKKSAKKEGVARSPIVTVMGHVDHGKTTLLDFIRKAQVAATEAGGMTQHIGAYDVPTPKGSVTFVDTPGHEAFTAMRARGARVTDIVVLVVAADDGVMPQTVEAVHHAQAAGVPIIVAINKIDKPEADVGRVERVLMEHGLVSEKLGGETILAPVSAKTGQGVDELLEMILLQAEVMELKADPAQKAVGTVIEARLDKGRGPVATVILQEGTLRVGDLVVAGTGGGKVRAMVGAQGQAVMEAPPSKPVEVLGLTNVPLAGDQLHAVESEEDARRIMEHRREKTREARPVAASAAARLEDLSRRAAEGGGEIPELRILVKGDVQGSVEALREALTRLSAEKVHVAVLHSGVGAITESDVTLAVASRAIIIGFNVRPDAKGRDLAETEKIQIRSYSIIYDVLDDVRKAMEGLLQPTYEERYLGRAEVRQLFVISKIGTIAGCAVTDGKIVRTASVRLLRDGKVVHEGKILSLRRFKEDAREVETGLECGIGIENYNDLKAGDLIEAFLIEEKAGKL